MKKVLVYYPFRLAEKLDSGSKLRPHQMLNAFRKWGEEHQMEIVHISGSSKERSEQFQTLQQSGKLQDLWFCYMENQTIPIWLTDPGHIPGKPAIDRQVLKFLKKNNVPTGIFYRDVYWKFDELYPLKGIKKYLMQKIYKLEESFYEKYMNVIFLPSNEMGKHVDIDRPMTALPPGGKDMGLEAKSVGNKPVDEKFKAIYVGGINNEAYGLFLLLDAIELVNHPEPKCSLTIVCRENEWEELPEEKRERISSLGVDVKHISGQELDDLYQKMDFAFIPRYRSVYNDFSVPVKLVEYLSNGLPVVATNCSAQANFLRSGDYGTVCDDEKFSMAEAIEKMMDRHHVYQKNIKDTFLKKHSWSARVKKVKEALVEEEI